MRLIEKYDLIMTRSCDNPECSEVIYRDTLDKDIAFKVTDNGGKPRFTCSFICGNNLPEEE